MRKNTARTALVLVTAGLGGCATRSVVVTNTADTPMMLSADENSDGWAYNRTLEPGESYRMHIGKGQPLVMPGITLRVD